MKDYPWGNGTPKWVRDATANDSDKSFSVPAGKVWDIKYIGAHLVASATVGNRTLGLNMTDGANRIASSNRTAAITATNSGTLEVGFGNGLSGTTSKQTVVGTTPSVGVQNVLPAMLLPAGFVIQVLDTTAVDAAADDLTVELFYVEYDA